MTDTSAEPASGHSGPGRFAAFRHRSFVLYFLARLFTTFGAQILSVAVIWHIYDLTKSALFTYAEAPRTWRLTLRGRW